jgi:hypothetical protein
MNDTTKAAADALDGIKFEGIDDNDAMRALRVQMYQAGIKCTDGRLLAFCVAAIERARADERKRCADLCEAISDQYREREGLRYPELRTDAETGAGECAAAIEALGTTMINGLTRAETDASASCAGLSAQTQEGRKA